MIVCIFENVQWRWLTDSPRVARLGRQLGEVVTLARELGVQRLDERRPREVAAVDRAAERAAERALRAHLPRALLLERGSVRLGVQAKFVCSASAQCHYQWCKLLLPRARGYKTIYIKYAAI